MEYVGFISYSSADRVIGRAFHAALEAYKMPKGLRDKAGGKRLGRIFRDRSDLAASDDLGTSLTDALRAARHLIVLCSPHSARSKWVNQEIDFFAGLGRAEQIVPVLVSGDPVKHHPATSPNGAFPPALFDATGRSTEPFAPDVRNPETGVGDGMEMAMLKTIARLIDVPLEELTQRHIAAIQADRRRTQQILALVTVLALGAVGGGTMAVMQTQTANERLARSIGSAARIVDIAAGFRDRYAIPSSAAQELFAAADTELQSIEADATRHPLLLLEKGKYLLHMAEFSEDIGDWDRLPELMRRASDGLSEAESGLSDPLQRLTANLPAPDAVEDAKLVLNDLQVRAAIRQNNFAAALAAADTALNAAQTTVPALTALRRERDGLCLKGDVYYQFEQPRDASTTYSECVARAAVVADRTDAKADQVFLVKAQLELAKVERSVDGREAALVLHQSAQAKASEILASGAPSNDDRMLAFRANAELGDSLLGVLAPASEALEYYATAQSLIEDLVRQDPNRTDWEREKLILLERMAFTQMMRLQDTDPQDHAAVLNAAGATLEQGTALAKSRQDAAPSNPARAHELSVFLELRANHTLLRAQYLADTDPTLGVRARADIDNVIALRRDNLADLVAQFKDGAHIQERYALANAHTIAGRIYLAFDTDPSKGLALYDRADEILLGLLNTDPTQNGWRYERALLQYNKAAFFLDKGAPQEAAIHIAQSEKIIDQLTTQFPDIRLYQQATAELAALRKLLPQN